MNKLILIASLLVGCAPQPASIVLDTTAASTVYETAPVALPTAKVLDAGGAAIEPAPVVTWSTSDGALATVDGATGTVTPIAEGTVEIVATVGEVKASWPLTVVLPDGVAVTGATDGQSLTIGTPVQLTGQVVNDDQPIAALPVTWKSSDEAIATVDGAGLVTPVAEGAVSVTAEGGGKSAVLALTVAAPVADLVNVAPTTP